MHIFVSDTQVIGETEETLFEFINQGSSKVLIWLNNRGDNTINYRFQQDDDGDWTDLDVSGTDLYNTLVAGQTKAINLSSANPKVRLVGNASGGSTLDFSCTRQFARPSGGKLPILSF